MRRWMAVSVAVCALVAPAAVMLPAVADERPQAATTDTDGADATPGVYVVMLDDAPLAAYHGSIPAYPATAPDSGQRFDDRRASVDAYRAFLLDRQESVLDSIGDPPVLYRYTTALHGFAADLTSEQVKELRTDPAVATLQHSDTLHLASAARPGPGLSAADDRAWREAGVARDAGSGVVIGVIDTGVWPENPSFDGVPMDTATKQRRYPGFTGSCLAGDRWGEDICDAKIVSARYFLRGFGSDNLAASEYASPRDANGHGSHTAAIAAGNPGVAVTIDGQPFGRITGVAPGAGLAVYKACWSAPDPEDDGCTVADTVAAIDSAVSDGVDVVSYSVTGGANGPADVIDQAFLNATEAGVFVATAAGDDGPLRGTVDHTSPWVTTVGASTHDLYRGRVRLGDGTVIDGAMVATDDVARTRLVRAADAALGDSSHEDAALCLPGTLDPTAVEGAIVLCDRGVSSRVDKGRVVARAGAAALVLANTSPGELPADVHALPAVHVGVDGRRQLMSYVNAASRPTAAIESVGALSSTEPRVASFSARGPASPGDGDSLKPDISAPGVNVLSAVAPHSGMPRIWDLMSGTSMSTPHVAGLAAVVTERRPSFSAAALKSAIITTAQDIEQAGPLASGAGVATPAAVDPGLVYDTDPSDWRRFLAGDLPGRALNQPSIAVGQLVGTQTVTRTITNVGRAPERYDATLTGLRGLSAAVDPTRVRLDPGESAEVDITFSAKRGAAYGEFASGALTWSGTRGHNVTSPIVVRPDFLDAPEDVAGDISTGSTLIEPRAGVTGTLRIDTVGPVATTPSPFTLEPGAFDVADPTIDSSSTMRLYFVTDAALVARFEVDAASDRDDLDLYVFRNGRLVASATSSAADEQITIENPPPGVYRVYLNSAASGLEDATTSGTLMGWVLDRDAADRLQVTPDPVTVTGGQPFGLQASWRGLDPERAWFGFVEYDGSTTRTYLTLR
ncbi:MAG: S8 family serine peptidase [Nocardioidaceae bacterium]